MSKAEIWKAENRNGEACRPPRGLRLGEPTLRVNATDAVRGVTVLLLQWHGVAEVLGIISNATTVEADEAGIGDQLSDFIDFTFAHENADVPRVMVF
jgi:hypothetical protein